jgi:hypothetical protein
VSAPKSCSEEVVIFGRWFLVVVSMSKCEVAINVVISTLIVTLDYSRISGGYLPVEDSCISLISVVRLWTTCIMFCSND